MMGKVLVVEPLGSHNLLTTLVGDQRVKVNAHADSLFQPDQTIWLRPAPEKIRWLDVESGLTLAE